MLRYGFLIATLLGLSAVASHATVTLQFSTTGTARATGFSDHLGVAGVDNMQWGVVVSGANSTFSGGSYDSFNPAVSQFLKVGGVDTDDYYVASGGVTSTWSATGNDPGGAGGIGGVADIFSSYPTGINSGDVFQIMWFDTNGVDYGMLGDPAFTLPNDGSTQSYAGSASFDNGTSADPVKPANLQFGAAVPEPSRFLLVGLGAFGMMVRRRRKA